MKASVHLRRRAAEAAKQMHHDQISITTFCHFESIDGGCAPKGQATISTSPDDIMIVLGCVEFDVTIYYFGLGKDEVQQG